MTNEDILLCESFFIENDTILPQNLHCAWLLLVRFNSDFVPGKFKTILEYMPGGIARSGLWAELRSIKDANFYFPGFGQKFHIGPLLNLKILKESALHHRMMEVPIAVCQGHQCCHVCQFWS